MFLYLYESDADLDEQDGATVIGWNDDSPPRGYTIDGETPADDVRYSLISTSPDAAIYRRYHEIPALEFRQLPAQPDMTQVYCADVW